MNGSSSSDPSTRRDLTACAVTDEERQIAESHLLNLSEKAISDSLNLTRQHVGDVIKTLESRAERGVLANDTTPLPRNARVRLTAALLPGAEGRVDRPLSAADARRIGILPAAYADGLWYWIELDSQAGVRLSWHHRLGLERVEGTQPW